MIAYAQEFNYDVFNTEFKKLINDERQSMRAAPLEYNSILINLSNIRSTEMARYGDVRYTDQLGNKHAHVRPDGSKWFTVFDEKNIKYYGVIKENLVQIYVNNLDELNLAKELFEVWKGSFGHYSTMIDKDLKSMGIGIALMDNNYIIATNLFSGMTDEELIYLNRKEEIPKIEAPKIETPKTIEEIEVVKAERILEKPNNPQPCKIYYVIDDELLNVLTEFILWNPER